MTRTALPYRRPNVTVDTLWDGRSISVTVGFNPAGQPQEVFASTPLGGTFQETLADCCVLASVALQHGIPPADLAKSLGKVPAWVNGHEVDAPASPVGEIMAVVLGVGV